MSDKEKSKSREKNKSGEKNKPRKIIVLDKKIYEEAIRRKKENYKKSENLINDLKIDIKNLENENEKLKNENEKLQKENEKLKKEKNHIFFFM